MPEALIAIPILAIIAAVPISIVSMVLRHKRAKMEIEAQRYRVAPQDNSLPVGELKRLISQAVEESNRPLQERIAQLEALVPHSMEEEGVFSSKTVGKTGTAA